MVKKLLQGSQDVAVCSYNSLSNETKGLGIAAGEGACWPSTGSQ